MNQPGGLLARSLDSSLAVGPLSTGLEVGPLAVGLAGMIDLAFSSNTKTWSLDAGYRWKDNLTATLSIKKLNSLAKCNILQPRCKLSPLPTLKYRKKKTVLIKLCYYSSSV